MLGSSRIVLGYQTEQCAIELETLKKKKRLSAEEVSKPDEAEGG